MYLYTLITGILWIFFAVYWIAKARNNKKTIERRNILTRVIAIFAIYITAIIIYGHWFHLASLTQRILPESDIVGIAGDLVCAAGIAFAIWARHILGRNWSGTVTIKEDHELIQSGPYAHVRNPMYTGILFGFLGSAIVRGTPIGFIADVILTLGLIVKIRSEEDILTKHFGESYLAYKKRVKRLIPFIY
jgi:protein-S-isoprenylcysteine O-methyltransferase Ste14